MRAIEVYMNRKEVEAVNGTSVKLQCTFKSSEPIFEDSVIVGWNFRPLKPGAEETVRPLRTGYEGGHACGNA